MGVVDLHPVAREARHQKSLFTQTVSGGISDFSQSINSTAWSHAHSRYDTIRKKRLTWTQKL